MFTPETTTLSEQHRCDLLTEARNRRLVARTAVPIARVGRRNHGHVRRGWRLRLAPGAGPALCD